MGIIIWCNEEFMKKMSIYLHRCKKSCTFAAAFDMQPLLINNRIYSLRYFVLIMKKLITFLFVLTTGVGTLFAESVKIGDLYYYLDDENKTAEVAPLYGNPTSITVPEKVTSDKSVTYDVIGISERAFAGCSELITVTIPNSIVYVGEYAFYNCPKLESIVYNDYLFAHLPQSYKGNYTIPDGIEYIVGDAFYGCPDLTAIEIPSSVNKIDKVRPFYECSALKSINVSEANSTFCSVGGVLYSKDKTILVAYPNGKTGNFTVPNSVKTIGPCAFVSNVNIQNISLPYQLTQIGDMAFYECKNLTSINIPNSVTAIGEYAFYLCKNLKSVTIGSGIASIGALAFAYCESIESVTIGSGIKSIYQYAFKGCIALSSITCKASNPPTCEAENVFQDVDKTIPLYVPKNSVEIYIRANVWKLFKNNTYAIESAIDKVNNASEIKSNKVIRDGVLYIERNGELFNLNGARVK